MIIPSVIDTENKIVCHACSQPKTASDFLPSRLRKDDYRCRECCKNYMAEYKAKNPEKVKAWARERMRKWRENNPELNQERSREHAEKRREKMNEYSREYSKNNLAKKNAQLKAAKAVKEGILIPQPCEVCGNPKAEKHHDDYSKPLEVRWLCTRHHRRLHKWVA